MVLLGRLQAVLQATIGNGLSFDPLSYGQDRRAAPAVDVGGGEIVDASVVSAVVVVVDESRDLRFEIASTPISLASIRRSTTGRSIGTVPNGVCQPSAEPAAIP